MLYSATDDSSSKDCEPGAMPTTPSLSLKPALSAPSDLGYCAGTHAQLKEALLSGAQKQKQRAQKPAKRTHSSDIKVSATKGEATNGSRHQVIVRAIPYSILYLHPPNKWKLCSYNGLT